MLNRLVHKADFERLLATRSRLRSAHFAVHHVAAEPAVRLWLPAGLKTGKLSTAPVINSPQAVDDFIEPGIEGHWIGCVVPKRHARRAVTRSLLKRQMRCAFERHAPGLAAGLWLLRLSQGFAVSQFVSARSNLLAEAARIELDQLLTVLQQRAALANAAARDAAAVEALKAAPEEAPKAAAGPHVE